MKKILILALAILLIGNLLAEHVVEQGVYGILLPEGFLPNQKVVVGECLDANFEDYAGATQHSFETYFENVSCEFINNTPSGLTVYGNGKDCVVEWCSPNEEQTGDYSIRINASSGNYSTIYFFNIGVYDYKIELTKDWNLISIPLVPENDNTSIEFVFGDIVEKVAYISPNIATILQFDATKNRWYKARPYENHSGFYWGSESQLKKIIPGYGYWIDMEEEATLYLRGEKFYNHNSSATPPSVVLATNSWNLIGTYGLEDLPTNQSLVSLHDLHGEAYYDLIYDEYLNDDFTNLSSKEGYWLSIKPFNYSDTITYKANYPDEIVSI